MAAFDYMVLTWVLKVLKAKGLDEMVINRLKYMYENHLTFWSSATFMAGAIQTTGGLSDT